MQVKKIVCIVFFFALIGFPSLGLAQDEGSEKNELTELKQQILELQRQMNEMKSKYENEIKESLLGIPGRVGEIIYKNGEWIFQELEISETDPEIMRELRNSYHGYGLQRIGILLGHSGELSNDVPALSSILWHWLLGNGLPK